MNFTPTHTTLRCAAPWSQPSRCASEISGSGVARSPWRCPPGRKQNRHKLGEAVTTVFPTIPHMNTQIVGKLQGAKGGDQNLVMLRPRAKASCAPRVTHLPSLFLSVQVVSAKPPPPSRYSTGTHLQQGVEDTVVGGGRELKRLKTLSNKKPKRSGWIYYSRTVQ